MSKSDKKLDPIPFDIIDEPEPEPEPEPDVVESEPVNGLYMAPGGVIETNADKINESGGAAL
jgi:hypothetical protein